MKFIIRFHTLAKYLKLRQKNMESANVTTNLFNIIFSSYNFSFTDIYFSIHIIFLVNN